MDVGNILLSSICRFLRKSFIIIKRIYVYICEEGELGFINNVLSSVHNLTNLLKSLQCPDPMTVCG